MGNYFIFRSNDDPNASGVHLSVGRQVITGEREFATAFGQPTSLERDLLLLAASIFAADRGSLRGEREDFARIIRLSIPVVNIGIIQPISREIENVLRLLSNDAWTISLRQERGTIDRNMPAAHNEGQTLLFSGGLDSLAAALEYRQNANFSLVSHVTLSSQTRGTQRDLVEMLRANGLSAPHYQFFVSSRDRIGFDHDIESSQRTRSFLFLILAGLVARRLNQSEIVMIAENGQMAIHLPLNAARIGAYSTHTAHPDVLQSMQRIISTLLGYAITIRNPYVHLTKAEVVERIWNQMRNAIPVANSCWRSARLPSGVTHCGECVPCLIRRISIESHGPDQTTYGRDVFRENFQSMPPGDEGRRNLADLCEFMRCFERFRTSELLNEWPELYSPNVDSTATIAMYKRAAAETRAVLRGYPSIAILIR